MTEAPAPPTVDRVLVEVTIAAPADAVWDAIRDPEKIYNWFGWDADSLEEEIDFIFTRHVRADAAARVLWFEGVPDRFEVEARGDGCVLRVVRAAPAGESWEGIYEDMVEGWISFVQQLRLAMERHDLAPRRTLYMSGRAKPGGAAPIDALGLTGVRAAENGQTFSTDLPTGERIDGEVWHRTPWQIGLTVPHWGNGLLIVTDKSVTEAAPHGRGMVILTTYGQSDAAFDALRERWQAWWNARYEDSPEAACS